jgi:hypothetical protein
MKLENENLDSPQEPQLNIGAVRRCLTFIPIYGWNYEWKYNKPSELKLLYHIVVSSAVLLIPIALFLKWYLNIA